MKTRVMPSWESARPTWPREVIRGGFVPVGVRVREPGSADSGCAYPHSQWQRQTSKRCPNGSAHEHEDDEAGHSRCVLSVRVASPGAVLPTRLRARWYATPIYFLVSSG